MAKDDDVKKIAADQALAEKAQAAAAQHEKDATEGKFRRNDAAPKAVKAD
jgi:hypothetical protein